MRIDKRVLEELKDPLIHLVRNCIDHGMEKADERERRNKPATGTIHIGIALKDSNLVELIVSDDGRGIDTAAVAAAAVRQGIMTQDQAKLMERDELLGVAFMSGLSTAPLITDISGRGLGLTIVREKVEKLGGTVMVTSETNKGTTFRMVVPTEPVNLPRRPGRRGGADLHHPGWRRGTGGTDRPECSQDGGKQRHSRIGRRGALIRPFVGCSATTAQGAE